MGVAKPRVDQAPQERKVSLEINEQKTKGEHATPIVENTKPSGSITNTVLVNEVKEIAKEEVKNVEVKLEGVYI